MRERTKKRRGSKFKVEKIRQVVPEGPTRKQRAQQQLVEKKTQPNKMAPRPQMTKDEENLDPAMKEWLSMIRDGKLNSSVKVSGLTKADLTA